MFTWTEESIQWYKEAAEYTKYEQAICKEVAPFIDEQDSVCDLGCGPGYISLQLAGLAKSVTAIDIESKALAVLQEKATTQELTNIEILQSDAANIPLEPKWDIVFVSFFKQSNEEIIRLLQMCKKRVIAVVSNGNKKGFWPEKAATHRKGKADQLVKELVENHLLTDHIRLNLDFGQPLFSKEEALRFIQHYSPQCSKEDAHIHISENLEIIEPDSYGNTFYLPNIKEVSIVIIDKPSN